MLTIVAFGLYFLTGLLLLLSFIWVYDRVCIYPFYKQLLAGNIAASVAFSGAVLGFAIALGAALFFTHDMPSMIYMSVFSCVVQLLVSETLNRFSGVGAQIVKGHLASGIFLAACEVAVGIVNGMSISY